jgi:hypothetical protein
VVGGLVVGGLGVGDGVGVGLGDGVGVGVGVGLGGGTQAGPCPKRATRGPSAVQRRRAR